MKRCTCYWNSGFTLIELLIAFALPNYLEVQVKARMMRSEPDMKAFETAFEA